MERGAERGGKKGSLLGLSYVGAETCCDVKRWGGACIIKVGRTRGRMRERWPTRVIVLGNSHRYWGHRASDDSSLRSHSRNAGGEPKAQPHGQFRFPPPGEETRRSNPNRYPAN